MGFTPFQLDPIDNRFYAHYIKTLDVICTKNVKSEGVSEGTVANDGYIDPDTGLLLPGVTVGVNGYLVEQPAITRNEVENSFTVAVGLFRNGVAITGTSLRIQVNDGVICPGAGTGPGQTVVQKHDFQIEPTFFAVPESPGGDFTALRFKAIIRYCLVVAKETVLKVNAAEPFCPSPLPTDTNNNG